MGWPTTGRGGRVQYFDRIKEGTGRERRRKEEGEDADKYENSPLRTFRVLW